MKIHDLSAQHIFPSKRYTIYECIPELVVTVPSARSTIVKKIKRFIIWPYKMQSCHFYRIAQCSSKNSMTLSSFSMTFHDLCYFPWLSGPEKMVFLNSMTFHDQGAPCTRDNVGSSVNRDSRSCTQSCSQLTTINIPALKATQHSFDNR